MLTIDEVGELLDEIAGELPEDFFTELNGGINLLPETKLHEQDLANNLYILGEYHHDQMGRYIVLYYGSICKTYPDADAAALRAQLKRIVVHEFTHHLESLAGERGLEYKDAAQLARYRDDWS